MTKDRLDLKRYAFSISGHMFGVEKSTVFLHGKPGTFRLERYLTRWILYWGWGTLRLHKFYRGDDDRASHTHPWWFITIPLSAYREKIFKRGRYLRTRTVCPFWPHYRSAGFEHIVLGRVELYGDDSSCRWEIVDKPFYTVVVTGVRKDGWGFYPRPGRFISWREYGG